MAKIRKRFSEWTSTAKTWPLSASVVAIAVSLSFIFWKGYTITWLHALTGLPLLCFAMTGIIYKLLFPTFKRNCVTNLIAHLLWTCVTAIATSFIATGSLHWEVLIAIIPIGLIAAGITHGKNKVAFEIMVTYAYLMVFSFFKVFPMTTIIVFLTVPIAFGCSKTILNSIEGGAHLTKDLGARTANLIHLFGALLAIAFAVERFI